MYEELFQRNIGIFNQTEQYKKIRNLTVALAGVGGVGGITAERLVRLGVGNFHLADPEAFDYSDSNRQAFCNRENIGSNKAQVLAAELRSINPEVNIKLWEEGVNVNNVNEFARADILIDSIEYAYLDKHILLHKTAREIGKKVITAPAIGFGSFLFVFTPESMTFEKYVGLPENATEELIKKYRIPLRKFCPRLPKYVNPLVALKAAALESYIPTCSLGVTAAASLLVTAVIKICVKGKRVPVVPDFIEFDFFADLNWKA